MKSLLKKLHIVSEEAENPTSPRFSKSPKHNISRLNPSPRVAKVKPSNSMNSSNSPDPEIEEEYQIQLALELSAREDPEAVQIEAVKQISLGSCSLEDTPSQVAAFRYWNYNALSYDDRIMDGFYDVYDIMNDSISEKMPSFDDLRGVLLSKSSRWEAVLVNRAEDDNLLKLERVVFNLRSNLQASVSGELVQKLAIFVSESMGGPVEDPDNMSKAWKNHSFNLKSTLGRVVLPLGSLRIGLGRHRALLFKVLTDSLGIQCRLVKRQYSGFDGEAMVFVKIDVGREYIVDLMADPGTLIPSDAAGFQLDFKKPRPRNHVHMEPSKVTSDDSKSPPNTNKASLGEITIMPPIQTRPHARSPSWTEGVSSPAVRKLKAKDVSLYMIDAAKENPILAQKLHDVLLESGVVAPPDLFNMERVPAVAAAASTTASETFKRDNEDVGDTESESQDHSEKSTKLTGPLDDVAECEIVWADITLFERIGLGSYGEVYRGDLYGTEVAVKKFLDQGISGESLEEFKAEVRIMKRLRHPNVVLFMGAITAAPNLSIVTEFLPRGSLYRLIRRPHNQLDERRRLKMALDTARGMNYLHKCTPMIVHRDLKSPNLLVDKNWVVKVCDFGLSRMKHSTFLSSRSTAGTAEWMAPEVLRNEPSDEKCDVFSYGVILWELCTLQQPWGGMNPMQVVGAVGFQNRRLDIPDDVDPAIADIIHKCWHTEPKMRPSFSEIMDALKPLQKPGIKASSSRTGPTAQARDEPVR